MGLGTLWVVVFVAMIFDNVARIGDFSLFRFFLNLQDGHRFGDLTIAELYNGEVWRTLTATFVHFGLLHISLNLWALYQLGTLVESWYGSASFVTIYVLTGAGGNLISGTIRHALHHPANIHAGGGSTVIMGLVALCAVVGWRARTPIGDYLKTQMVGVLLLTAALGIGASLAGLPVIDNWGHFGGSVMGAVIGFANRGLVRQAGRFSARIAGALGLLLLAASAFALVADDRAEGVMRRQAIEMIRQRLATDERLIRRLESLRSTFRATASARHMVVRGMFDSQRPSRIYPGPVMSVATTSTHPGTRPSQSDPDQEFALSVLGAALKSLNSMNDDLDGGVNANDYRRARQILNESLRELPTQEEVHEVDDRLSAILTRVRMDHEAAERERKILQANK